MTRRSRRDHAGFTTDVREIVDHLGREAPEQVDRFLNLLERHLESIEPWPLAHAPLFDDYRHVLLRPFRYMIVYVVEEQTIDVLAVLHAQRHPEWIKGEVRGRSFDD